MEKYKNLFDNLLTEASDPASIANKKLASLGLGKFKVKNLTSKFQDLGSFDIPTKSLPKSFKPVFANIKIREIRVGGDENLIVIELNYTWVHGMGGSNGSRVRFEYENNKWNI